MKLISLVMIIAALSLGGCKAADEDPLNENKPGGQEKPGDNENSQKANAIANRVYFEIKSMTPIAMTDELVTLRISYTFNQGIVRTQQVSVSIKKGEARGQDYSNWIGGNNGTKLEALVFRSRTKYDAGDMFGFAFEVIKPFDGGNQRSSQAMIKAFISDIGARPTLQLLKSKFEYPAKTELRTWLNE
jgi:hypothetical protein